MFGSIGAKVAQEVERPAIAVIASPGEFQRLDAARDRIAEVVDSGAIVNLVRVPPEADVAAQRQRLLSSKDPPVLGVLEGGLDRPRLTGSVSENGATARQLQWIIDEARSPAAPVAGPRLQVTRTGLSAGSLASKRSVTARAGQAILFLLTILLAGMLLSQLIEEKSNKVIEILAAAVPIDAVFVGKLFAMLAVSFTGIAVWGGATAFAIASLSSGGLAGLPPPAVGWPLFALFVLVYFAMSYLLIGAAFLGIGGHASTVREVQTLSMPVTMSQVLIFALASAAVGQPDSMIGVIAAVFPLSSPYVMLARAAESPDLWPHLLAIPWQIAWVAVILRIAAGHFRRSVLKSGPARSGWFRTRRPKTA
jgi:ABC-2 type transport system permease protein